MNQILNNQASLYQEYNQQLSRQRGIQQAQRRREKELKEQIRRENLSRVKKAKKLVQQNEANSDSGFWFIIFNISIIADVFSLLPFVGNIFAFIFSGFLSFFYIINGKYSIYKVKKIMKTDSSGLTNAKDKAVKMLVVSIIGYLIESFCPGIGVLPFFTITAFINWAIDNGKFGTDSIKF